MTVVRYPIPAGSHPVACPDCGYPVYEALDALGRPILLDRIPGKHEGHCHWASCEGKK